MLNTEYELGDNAINVIYIYIYIKSTEREKLSATQ